MLITSQISDFVGFIIIGLLLSIIFDFFRTYRLLKRISTFSVIIQDIIYFFISTFVIAQGIIHILDSSMRLYIFLAIIIGFAIYYAFFSKYVIKIYKIIFNTSKEILEFILLPLNLVLHIFVKICIFMKKIIEKCCKKFGYMLPLICKQQEKISKLFNPKIKKVKTKEGRV